MKSPTEPLHAFRIVSPRWAHDAFSGDGARKFGGRWNSPGLAMVYTSSSRALAALEMLVHLPTPLSRAKPYKIIEIAVPAGLVDHYPASALPSGWRSSPPSKITMEIGDDWLSHGNRPALLIPSALIPEESNLLLNPAHPDFSKIQLSSPADFSFDSRI